MTMTQIQKPVVGNSTDTWGTELNSYLDITKVVYPQEFAGADAGLQIQAAIDSLPASGGIVDGRGYTGIQTISSMITVGTSTSGILSTRPVQLLLSHAATFQPSAAGTYMFDVKQKGQLIGANIDVTNVNYAAACIVLDDKCFDGHLTQVHNCNLTNDKTGGIGILMQTPAEGAWGICFASLQHIRITGFGIGLSIYASAASQFINGNFFDDIEITNAVVAISLAGAGGINDGNHFSNIAIQAGADTTVGIVLEVGSYNQFINTSIWDMPAAGGAYIVKTGCIGNFIMGFLNVQEGLGTLINEEPLKNTILDLLTSRLVVGYGAAGTFAVVTAATWDPGSLADGVGETSAAITVTGAALGDFVLVSAPYDLQGITCNGYVSAANTVKIRIQNETAGTIDLASGAWRVRVIKA